MTQIPPDKNAPIDPVTVRIVLRLDDAIAAFRAGERTGLHALDSASGLMIPLTDEEVMSEAERRAGLEGIARRPDRVELAILAALADMYGSEMLTNASLGYALRLIARYGGVALVQRVLWGDSPSDLQLATMLGATREALSQIAQAFSDDLMADAKDALAMYRPNPRPRPPGAPSQQPNPTRGNRG